MCCLLYTLLSVCFPAKLLMDYILLLVLMPALLTGGLNTETSNMTESTPAPNVTSPIYTSASTITNKPNNLAPPPTLGRIKVKWLKDNPCQGFIYFLIFPQGEKYVCYQSSYFTKRARDNKMDRELCEERRCGDGNFVDAKSEKHQESVGYMIHENLTVSINTTCSRMYLICKDVVSKELVAYKVITGLLLTLILAVLLCRFAQPTYIAVRKRLSHKRQDRWIGPTQSQSVSYHRGKAGNPNNNTTKRYSYPGLERLTVNPSREPSSNRNSDYDSYGG